MTNAKSKSGNIPGTNVSNVDTIRARAHIAGGDISTAKDLAAAEGWSVARARRVLAYLTASEKVWLDHATATYRNEERAHGRWTEADAFNSSAARRVGGAS